MDSLEDVDPFLLRKWEHAFEVYFDLNKNRTVEWADFALLEEIIGRTHGLNSEGYRHAKSALEKIWNRLTEFAGVREDAKITMDNWKHMWNKALHESKTPEWQKRYLEYMFLLFDASGDLLIDQAEYIQVMNYFGVDRAEALSCFDKFAKNERGDCVMAITYDQYVALWDEFFFSTDMNAPGNYLFGFI